MNYMKPGRIFAHKQKIILIMKELFHICLTAHSEVLLRNIDDVRLLTNNSALSAYRCATDMLTDSFMSTHLHEMVMTDSPAAFAKRQAQSITKAFNHKYGRTGPLFGPPPFILRIQGPKHTQMAFNYSLRQGMHHGQSETPFSYPWSTCNYLFTGERGVNEECPAYSSRSELREFFSKNSDFPDEWQADRNGILLRKSFEQLKIVENWYGSARSYLFSMIRRTSEEWLAEQQKDDTKEPAITLDLLETGYSSEEVSHMLENEGNSKYVHRGMSDMEVCEIIDNECLGRFGADTVYALSQDQKDRIAKELNCDLGIHSMPQISRCLVMKYHR